MKELFVGEKNFQHSEVPQTGVLLVNMGTPDAPTPQALRPYLKQFLWDPRVIELSRPMWWLILNLFVLNTRPRRSAKLYAKIWTPEGSPLLVNCIQQRNKLATALERHFGRPIPVALGMRYGNPSIPSALAELRAKSVRKILVMPLYPQYSSTTTASGFDVIGAELSKWRWIPEIRTINCYHDEPAYITALAASVRELWSKQGEPERLLLSFHGIPKRYFLSGDPYHCHCLKTGRLVAEQLGLAPERYAVCFQSLFGREEWLRPYTSDRLKEWAGAGIRKVDVICPGFTSDCVETLEEIDVEYREVFTAACGSTSQDTQAGTIQYRYIPALNDRPDFIDMLKQLSIRHLQGWEQGSAASAAQACQARYQKAVGS